jgi:hypothetical protein
VIGPLAEHHLARSTDPGGAVPAPEPRPAPEPPRLDEVMPVAMRDWIRAWSRKPLTVERLDRSTMYQLYQGWDAHRARTGADPVPGLPAFATVVRALDQACYRDDLAVEALQTAIEARSGPPDGAAGTELARALVERVGHARRWLALRGIEQCWIRRTPPGGCLAEPEREALAAAVAALRADRLPGPPADRAVRAALFGIEVGPSLRAISMAYPLAELVVAIESYVEDGARPLRDDVLARLAAPPGAAPARHRKEAHAVT